MTDNPASGQYSDELGGPDPDEQRTDLLGGQEPATDELGGPEPDEQRTDLLGGQEPATDELGGPDPDEQRTDLLGGQEPGKPPAHRRARCRCGWARLRMWSSRAAS